MTKNSEKEKNKKVPFAVLRKGVASLALAGVMALSPIVFAGCSNGQNGKDGLDGEKWYSGVDYSVDSNATNAKAGDFYIDTDDYILYQKQADGTWTVLMQNFGRPGQEATAPTITINNDGYWVINGTVTAVKATAPTISINGDGYWVIDVTATEVKATATDGLTPEIKDGYWWIGTTNTNVKATGDAGTPGANGKSAYELAVDAGFTGTKQEWLESLKGNNGNDGLTPKIKDGYWWIGDTNTNIKATGENGKSAYDLAVEEGFDGTVQEWIASLKGQKGDKGDAGATWLTGTLVTGTGTGIIAEVAGAKV